MDSNNGIAFPGPVGLSFYTLRLYVANVTANVVWLLSNWFDAGLIIDGWHQVKGWEKL